jgi:hypothetical protein
MNVERAELFAARAHRGQLQPTGEPLFAHVTRVAAATPEFACPVAWLQEVLKWTSVSEQELLAEGVSDDELRALRLLTRTVGRSSELGYLTHVGMIASAGGPAGVLARGQGGGPPRPVAPPQRGGQRRSLALRAGVATDPDGGRA